MFLPYAGKNSPHHCNIKYKLSRSPVQIWYTVEGKEVKPVNNSYLQEGELVLLVLVLTFVFTIYYAKRKAKKRK
ncbi:hypothetical protein BCE02nite_39360 [Brevibacillus centrosporus]|nr:hypothetical protein BCE02nite_39360 [Brevibacillus centrosporus]